MDLKSMDTQQATVFGSESTVAKKLLSSTIQSAWHLHVLWERARRLRNQSRVRSREVSMCEILK